MDLFLYKAAVKELENCKTIYRLEELLRGYYNEVTLNRYKSFEANEKSGIGAFLNYKLYSLSLKLFTERSKKVLPDKIYYEHKAWQKNIINSTLEYNHKSRCRVTFTFNYQPTYENLIDWFEHDTHIEMPSSYVYIERLNAIIGDKPIHFDITFNYVKNSFEKYSTELPDNHQRLIYAIRYKQINFPNTPQTIWDMFIKDCMKQVTTPIKQSFIDEQVLKLKQQIKALEDLQSIAMLNSESLLQQTFVSMCRVLYPDLVLNLSLNGISLNGLSPTQKSQLIAQAKREGMETGIQDLSIYLPNAQILNLEFKRPKGGTQSDDQKLIESKLKTLGHNYYLVRSTKECFDLIIKHTPLDFRETQFHKLQIPTDGTVLTKGFLHFPKNTELAVVKNQLRELYCI